jgi:hypothetical protein
MSYRRFLHKFNVKPIELTDNLYKIFVDTGYVPERIIRLLAFKIIKTETLTQEEMAVFIEYTSEIEDAIKVLTKEN